MSYTDDSGVYHDIVSAGADNTAGDIVYTEVVFRNSSDRLSETPELFTGIMDINVEAPYSRVPRLAFKSDAPLPFNMLGVTYLFEVSEPFNPRAGGK